VNGYARLKGAHEQFLCGVHSQRNRNNASSLSDLKEIGYKSVWVVYISHPVTFSLRFFKSDRLPGREYGRGRATNFSGAVPLNDPHWDLAEYIARYAEDLFAGFGISGKRRNFTFLAGRLRKQVVSGLLAKS
jgi:hypothetical protein